ncbi:hypothetical protein, conserved [Plasmodium vivax]|uniref:VIR protein n=1 Tax=Plasmodium vivax TaxID=5855 RepID=A0A1G4E3I9_PLAVI|nr:hypothetical protein, conserved [Plasmodium vivax]
MSDEKEFTLDKIKKIQSFMGNSKFYKIYEVFSKSCQDFSGDFKNESCYNEDLMEIDGTSEVTELLKELYSSLYRIYASVPFQNNTYFDYNISEYGKMYCISLKYWLYDQIIKREFKKTDINEIFTGWTTYLKGKIKGRSQDLCTFNNLLKDEIKKIKNIYALYSIFYDNTEISETCNNDKCKYIDYFGQGLDNFINSIKKCSTDSSNNEYCNEFNEFLELCKKNNENAGITIYEVIGENEPDGAGKHLLFSEKYKDKLLYIYLKNKELINFVKTSDFLSNKSTTIAATSVVGSAIGLSSIFYYFYKFTPFGSSLRKGQRKNIVNIDEEAHNELLYTSNLEQPSFKNREYKVAYHNYNNS